MFVSCARRAGLSPLSRATIMAVTREKECKHDRCCMLPLVAAAAVRLLDVFRFHPWVEEMLLLLARLRLIFTPSSFFFNSSHGD